MSKAKWFRFFEQAEAELGIDTPQEVLETRTEELLADFEADRADQALDTFRDNPPIPPKPVDWR